MAKRVLSEAKRAVLDRALTLDPTLQRRRCTQLGPGHEQRKCVEDELCERGQQTDNYLKYESYVLLV